MDYFQLGNIENTFSKIEISYVFENFVFFVYRDKALSFIFKQKIRFLYMKRRKKVM